jgi:hypothetical protein
VLDVSNNQEQDQNHPDTVENNLTKNPDPQPKVPEPK